MGRIYTATFTDVAVSAVQDLLELNAPSTAIVIIHSAFIGQNSDAGDAASELLTIQISRSTGSSGAAGSVLTPEKHLPLDTAFAGTVEANNTTQATTTATIRSDTFNVQAGWVHLPTPEERIVIPPGGRVVIELPNAPSDSLTMSGSITFEEVG